MLDSLIALRLRPILSDFCVIGSHLTYENEENDSFIVYKRDFDILVYPAEEDADSLLIGQVSGYVVDLPELLKSFKENDHIYIYDFEQYGEEVAHLYSYIYDNINPDDTSYSFIYIISSMILTEKYNLDIIKDVVFKVLLKALKSILKIEFSHVWIYDELLKK